MATLRKRGGKWHVQVRRKGHPNLTKTFTHKADADLWVRRIERGIDLGEPDGMTIYGASLTMKEMIIRYRDTITVTKKGSSSEAYRLSAMASHQISQGSAIQIRSTHISQYRDERLELVSPSSVLRELGLFHRIFHVAHNEWGIPIKANPVDKVTMPMASKPRERRLESGELDRLIKGTSLGRSPLLAPVILFAIETGMRRGEIVAATWEDYDRDRSVLHIPKSKNGRGRTIPMSGKAQAIIKGLEQTHPQIFPTTGNAIRLAWERLKRRADIEDLRFHDLRHEAISRFFELGLSIPEVALISGHRDPRMLFRYTHLKAEDIVHKLLR